MLSGILPLFVLAKDKGGLVALLLEKVAYLEYLDIILALLRLHQSPKMASIGDPVRYCLKRIRYWLKSLGGRWGIVRYCLKSVR